LFLLLDDPLSSGRVCGSGLLGPMCPTTKPDDEGDSGGAGVPSEVAVALAACLQKGLGHKMILASCVFDDNVREQVCSVYVCAFVLCLLLCFLPCHLAWYET
jgi:hypothetical protein